MIVTLSGEYLACDACGKVGHPVGPDRNAAEAALAFTGWGSCEDEHLCPECLDPGIATVPVWTTADPCPDVPVLVGDVAVGRVSE